MDAHTTRISTTHYRPLDVEWLDYNERPGFGRHTLLPDGTSKRLPGTHVSLFCPPVYWDAQPSRILNLSPRTALNLLAWLEAERAELEAQAKAWEEADHA